MCLEKFMKSLINFALPDTQTVTRNSIYIKRKTSHPKETVFRFQSLINDVEEFFLTICKIQSNELVIRSSTR